METRELRYFVAVAEELHFARAAARVGIEQSPLSKAISEFERRLGVHLFIRTRRSTTLTLVGESLLKDARRILADIDCARRNVDAAAAGRSGRIRIAVCDGLSHPRVAKLLARSREDDPDVDVQVIHSPFSEQLRALRVGEVDIGFGLSASTDSQLRSVPLWQDAVVLVVQRHHRSLEQRTIKKIATEARHVMILGEQSSVSADLLDTWLLSAEHGDKRIEYVKSIELLLTLVAAGYGVGIISAAQAESIRRPDLTLRRLKAGATITTFMLQRGEGATKLVDRFTERARQML